jgi:hypothetical protein
MEMTEPRRSDRKRTATDFLGATETVARDAGRTRAVQAVAREAREAAVASAYQPLGGLVQLGAVGGGEGRVWVGAPSSPALSGVAPSIAERQQFLDLVQQYQEMYMYSRTKK